MNKIARVAACVGSTAAFVAVLPISFAGAVTTVPSATDGTIFACASEFSTPSSIVRIDFDGPTYQQASLLGGDCQSFSVPAGRYHFNTPGAGSNPCAPGSTLAVVIRRNGINFLPTTAFDYAASVDTGAETRVKYFCG